MMTVQVTGMAELERKIVAMGQKVGLKAIRSALVAGAQIVKKDSMARVPVLTGRLKRSLYIKRMSKPNPFKENVIFGARHGKKMQKRGLDAFYWGFIEFGHKDRAGKNVPAKSFIRPAFESSKQRALDRIKVVLQNKISQYAKEPA
jgi:HK97 gp10 family phage protein